MLTPVIDTSKEYGLVLEGGGAKGAYQIGAWKALKEAGVKINAVAGTSVGALNGALICAADVEQFDVFTGNGCGRYQDGADARTGDAVSGSCQRSLSPYE